jgi:hypothetical protein
MIVLNFWRALRYSTRACTEALAFTTHVKKVLVRGHSAWLSLLNQHKGCLLSFSKLRRAFQRGNQASYPKEGKDCSSFTLGASAPPRPCEQRSRVRFKSASKISNLIYLSWPSWARLLPLTSWRTISPWTVPSTSISTTCSSSTRVARSTTRRVGKVNFNISNSFQPIHSLGIELVILKEEITLNVTTVALATKIQTLNVERQRESSKIV